MENMTGLKKSQIAYIQAVDGSETGGKIFLDLVGEMVPNRLMVDLLGKFKAEVG